MRAGARKSGWADLTHDHKTAIIIVPTENKFPNASRHFPKVNRPGDCIHDEASQYGVSVDDMLYDPPTKGVRVQVSVQGLQVSVLLKPEDATMSVR